MSPITPTAAVEQRIQRLEDSATDFQAHAAAEEFRFEMISNQIKDLGERMDKAVGELSKTVREMREQQEEQGRKLDSVDASVQGLLKTSNAHEEDFRRVQEMYVVHQRNQRYRKHVISAATILGTAVVVKFGHHIADWFAGIF